MTDNISLHNDEDYWAKVDREAIVKSIDVIEDAAKQLITVTSLLQGLYFAAISFSDVKKVIGSVQWWQIACLIAPFALWLISMYFASRVFVPKKYPGELETGKSVQEDWGNIKKEYETIRDIKFSDLKRARLALMLSLLTLLLDLILYLISIPLPPI